MRDEGRAKKLSSEKLSGSNVSAKSHRRISSSSSARGLDASILKQYSVSISRISGESFCFIIDNSSFFFASERAGLR